MKKIVFILPSIDAGGAERVVTFLFNNLNRKTFECKLLVLGNKKDNFYNLNYYKDIVFLDKKNLKNAGLDILIFLKKNSPNIVFSSIWHLNLFLIFFRFLFPKIKFIIRESNVKSIRRKYDQNRNLLVEILEKFLIKKATRIIAQSKDICNDLVDNFNIKKEKIVLINNPITLEKSLLIKKLDKKQINFITIASFHEKKGLQRLIRIVKNLNFNFKYFIVGGGPLFEELNSIIISHNLKSKIILTGITKDIDHYFSFCDLFLQGSYVEGFPNSIVESLSRGIPCIAMEAPGGHNEIIIDNFNGFICKNENEFRKSIIFSLNKSWDHDNIIKDVYSRFSSEKILKQYEKIFTTI